MRKKLKKKKKYKIIRIPKKVGSRTIQVRRLMRINPDKHDSSLYYTDIIRHIKSNPKLYDFMKRRYDRFLLGIIDDMDASYAYKLKKEKELNPNEFIMWYIVNGEDIKNAKNIIKDKSMDPRIRSEMQELVDRLQILNG